MSTGILTQLDQGGQWVPMAFFSRKITPCECNYGFFRSRIASYRGNLFANGALRGGFSVQYPMEVITDHLGLKSFNIKRIVAKTNLGTGPRCLLVYHSLSWRYHRSCQRSWIGGVSRIKEARQRHWQSCGLVKNSISDSWNYIDNNGVLIGLRFKTSPYCSTVPAFGFIWYPKSWLPLHCSWCHLPWTDLTYRTCDECRNYRAKRQQLS